MQSLTGEGRRAQVILLDDRRLDIVVQPKLTVEELLNIVASHCQLRDPDKYYFGLTFLDDRQQYHWLYRERCVLDHDFPKKVYLSGISIILYHTIKFYVHSVSQLAYSSTVELYFLQVQQQISRGYFQVDSKSMFRLSGFAMQAYFGDYVNESVSRNRMKRLPLFPASLLKEYPSLAHCEDKLMEMYKSLIGLSRGAAILKYMSLVEKIENYGMHFYEVKEKTGNSVLLGLCSKGLYQFEPNDPSVIRQRLHWKQLENLYYRDRKFSVEVHDPKRVVQSLSSFNLLEDANEDFSDQKDELVAAVNDPTTQVSLSRRSFIHSNVYVIVFVCDTPQLCKNLWSMAIAQHQFYLDYKKADTMARSRHLAELQESLNQSPHLIVGPMAEKSANSTSDLGSSLSSQSIRSLSNGPDPDETTKRSSNAREKLKLQKQEKQKLLTCKMNELKNLCIEEGEITGVIPVEIQNALLPGEPVPKVKRRVGTTFSISPGLVEGKVKADDIAKLEADVEIRRKIVGGFLKLAGDESVPKNVKRKRQHDYEEALHQLRLLELKLHQMRNSEQQPATGDKKHSYNSRYDAFPQLTSVQPEVLRNSSRSVCTTEVLSTSTPPSPFHGTQEVRQGMSRLGVSGGIKCSFSLGSVNQKPGEAGYRSHVTYQCPYRQRNYPTLSSGAHRTRSFNHLVCDSNPGTSRTMSSVSLHSTDSSVHGNSGSGETEAVSPLRNFKTTPNGEAVNHLVGAYNIPNQRTSWDQECLEQVRLTAEAGSSESLNGDSGLFKTVAQDVKLPKTAACRPRGPTAYTCSLDRRLCKQKRDKATTSDALWQCDTSRSTPRIELLDRSPTRPRQNPLKNASSVASAAEAGSRPVVFRLGENNGSKSEEQQQSIEFVKPYFTADYLKYTTRGHDGAARKVDKAVIVEQRKLSSSSSRSAARDRVSRLVKGEYRDPLVSHSSIPKMRMPQRPPRSSPTQEAAAGSWQDGSDRSKLRTATIV